MPNATKRAISATRAIELQRNRDLLFVNCFSIGGVSLNGFAGHMDLALATLDVFGAVQDELEIPATIRQHSTGAFAVLASLKNCGVEHVLEGVQKSTEDRLVEDINTRNIYGNRISSYYMGHFDELGLTGMVEEPDNAGRTSRLTDEGRDRLRVFGYSLTSDVISQAKSTLTPSS